MPRVKRRSKFSNSAAKAEARLAGLSEARKYRTANQPTGERLHEERVVYYEEEGIQLEGSTVSDATLRVLRAFDENGARKEGQAR